MAVRLPSLLLALLLGPAAPAVFAQASAPKKAPKKARLPRARRLDRGVELRRDSATGELRDVSVSTDGRPSKAGAAPATETIRARVSLVEVSCNVFTSGGAPLRGLAREDFRLSEDGVVQAIAHFDASSDPATIALVLDASPSIFRELSAMKAAARTLARELSPRDEVAVVAFAGETRLLLPLSRDRTLLERALASPALAQVADSRESNIYQATYLTARELFRGRTGRKAIVLLTDGQDSGLGLGWDPASAMPHPGQQANRLSFEDLVRELAADGVEVYAISTQPRPTALTSAWLDVRRTEMLVTPAARELGIPHYTLYLAELVRRVGGQLYFLREIGTLSDVYRLIAANLTAQYTLGYYPSAGLARPGWRALRVELGGRPDARLVHRLTYYVPAGP